MNNNISSEKAIISGLKYLEKKGMNIGSEGNVSIRTKNGFFISPSAFKPSELKKENIPLLNLNGKNTGSVKPSSEWKMHLVIYKKLKNIKAIVHTHSLWASCLSCFRENIPSFHYMIAELGGNDIKCSSYATFGTKKLAENVLKALYKRNGCLLANHGQITVGKNLDEAIAFAESLEKLSKQYFFCRIFGKPRLLNNKQMNEVIDLFSSYKSKH